MPPPDDPGFRPSGPDRSQSRGAGALLSESVRRRAQEEELSHLLKKEPIRYIRKRASRMTGKSNFFSSKKGEGGRRSSTSNRARYQPRVHPAVETFLLNAGLLEFGPKLASIGGVTLRDLCEENKVSDQDLSESVGMNRFQVVKFRKAVHEAIAFGGPDAVCRAMGLDPDEGGSHYGAAAASGPTGMMTEDEMLAYAISLSEKEDEMETRRAVEEQRRYDSKSAERGESPLETPKASATPLLLENLRGGPYPQRLVISGSPDKDCDGPYEIDGEPVNGAPRYRRAQGYYFVYRGYNKVWRITWFELDIAKDQGDYCSESPTESPEQVSRWVNSTTRNPYPSMRVVPGGGFVSAPGMVADTTPEPLPPTGGSGTALAANRYSQPGPGAAVSQPPPGEEDQFERDLRLAMELSEQEHREQQQSKADPAVEPGPRMTAQNRQVGYSDPIPSSQHEPLSPVQKISSPFPPLDEGGETAFLAPTLASEMKPPVARPPIPAQYNAPDLQAAAEPLLYYPTSQHDLRPTASSAPRPAPQPRAVADTIGPFQEITDVDAEAVAMSALTRFTLLMPTDQATAFTLLQMIAGVCEEMAGEDDIEANRIFNTSYYMAWRLAKERAPPTKFVLFFREHLVPILDQTMTFEDAKARIDQNLGHASLTV
uniref:Uncharacterized protein n=2 Tax=Rhizochromulina marina TaxID=1034831 RepID=A0A7S2RZN5_9STRA